MAKKTGDKKLDDHIGEVVVPMMSEQDRLQRCNEELAQVLQKYGCELRAIPISRAEGTILIISATPQLAVLK